MEVNGKGKLSNLIVVGDRVLIKPVKHDKTSKGGLLLPPGYQEKEDVLLRVCDQSGTGLSDSLAR
ncbi:MAG: co-chaperone GroES family protein [Bacteroidales bacterium]